MTSTRWLAGILAAALLAVAAALISQHAFGMQPCPWCVLQRVVFLAIAIVCLAGMPGVMARFRIAIGSLVLLLSASGAAAAVWQHFVAASSQSCNFTMADKIVRRTLNLDQLLPSVFDARATCFDAAVNLLGIPYEFWSFGLFVLMGLAAVQYMRAPRGR
jgi:disulfide bond formation protein DsbB